MAPFCCYDCINMITHPIDMFVNISNGQCVPGITYGCYKLLGCVWWMWKASYVLFELVPNGFYGAKIGGTCWVEEEWDLMVGKPFLC